MAYEIKREGNTAQVWDRVPLVLHSPNKGAVVTTDKTTKVAEFYGPSCDRQALLWIKANEGVVAGRIQFIVDEADVQDHAPIDRDVAQV